MQKECSRRGVTSILAMMFLVLFGSLGVAMAVASKGNLRTAQTHLHVVSAMGAAETGMAIAQKNLREAVSRFVVEKGVITSGFGQRLWDGSYTGADGDIEVRSAPSGRADSVTVTGIGDAVLNAHLYDANTLKVTGFLESAEIITGEGGSEYADDYWVRTGLVAISESADEEGAKPAAYQITYAPLANGTDVRIIVTGYSSIGASGSSYQWGWAADNQTGRAVSRTIYQDYRLVKRTDSAVLSPSRIMIGKNVSVVGDLGCQYDDVAQNNGHPLVVRSDFYGLDANLDKKLDDLYAAMGTYDIDGDNRLRLKHATESEGIPSGSKDYDGDGAADNAFADATGDGYVDEFDVFINHYDADGDHRLVMSSALTAGTPAAGKTPEFTADDDLAILIDSSLPDRNRNKVYGWADDNGNGRWDDGEEMADVSPSGANSDQVLGWRDGYLDKRDQFAKIRGGVTFKASQSQWAAAHTDYAKQLKGPIVPDRGEDPRTFGDSDMTTVGADSFTDTQTPLKLAADGSPFAEQVATQLGISSSQLATYTEAKTDATKPRYWRSDLSDATVFAATGKHLWERMPFSSPAPTDYYFRPRYENMTFRNVIIPRGNNGLFINCKFIGVTLVQTYTTNTHPLWSTYGKMERVGSAAPTFITTPLDKSDFVRYTSGNVADGPANYADFPDPPVIDGAVKTGAARNTKLYSNNIRFHDCLFVGSIVSDTPQAFTHARNKLQYTGATRFTTTNPDDPTDPGLNPDSSDMEEIEKTSMMVPNYSVDIGQFNSPTDTYTGSGAPASQNVQLVGTIVAGVLDVRGNTTIDGSLLLTFAPVAGEGPLVDPQGNPIGNPAGFNATLGYFGPDDGDGESLDPEKLPIVGGKRIVGWDTDADGIADVAADQPQPPGSTAVPFYGYGRVKLIWNPDRPMPDGIMMPLGVVPVDLSYREGRAY